ncbi:MULTISPECIES: BON domain-containing protein [unclassified Paludibacterium]|uniref:BON domain-containing protein n=1 Tax=unclassified Paludibacterium TaxID=2618429 RepID=UPI001C0579D3|nr:BON domain-containing protein [Paludibacterium sp. B53371]BEV73027.1 hypothetical protein THUN1379_25090 [Paludibacterium sp. THUN1379]
MSKRTLLSLLLASALGTSLSGCLPLVAGGVAGTAMVATDRRTSGAYVDDQSIELKATSQLGQKFPKAHVNVNSFNRTALMTGEVASDDERTKVEMLVRALPGVKRVENYTVVAEPSTFGQRNNDTWITTKVRSRLISGEGNYSSQAIKLVTERGVVYMLGLVTRAEGDAAAAVVSQTAGVQKVVTLFEYLNAVPAPAGATPAAQ